MTQRLGRHLQAWVFACVLGLAAHSAAWAVPLTWTISGTFDDGGTLNGSFVYDADTDMVSNWNLMVAGGDTALPTFTYTPSNSGSPDGGSIDGFEIFVFTTPGFSRFMGFPLNPNLTNAGGSANIVVSPGNSSEINNFFANQRNFMGGVATTSAADALAMIISDVQAFVTAGTLNQGQGNALISKLEAAIAKLAEGKPQTAINQLQAFINAVQADTNGHKLTTAQAQPGPPRMDLAI